MLDSESGSLYALCRSWVRNGVPHEIQVSIPSFFPFECICYLLVKNFLPHSVH
jgi:hypothetical protein